MRLNKGSDNRLKQGRWWLYLTKDCRQSINFEWSFWTHFWHAGISMYGGDSDRDLQFSFACGLFSFWLTFEGVLPKKWQPDYRKRFSSEREIRIAIHGQCIWISLWEDPMGWESKQPWWFSFTLHPVDWVFGKTKYSSRDLEVRQNVPLRICPHEEYKATVKLFESTWKRPRWFAHKLVRAEVKVDGGVRHPGKGTMSYNCDDDFMYSLTTPATTTREALNKFRDSVLGMRERYPL